MGDGADDALDRAGTDYDLADEICEVCGEKNQWCVCGNCVLGNEQRRTPPPPMAHRCGDPFWRRFENGGER